MANRTWGKKGTNFLSGRKVFDHYLNKYFNLFMGQYRFKEFSDQQNDFFFRKLWNRGAVASFEFITGDLGLADFAETGEYNYLDFPTRLQLLNPRGYAFIPSGILENGKDVVIAYANPARISIKEHIEYIIAKIVKAETCIRRCMKASSYPWIISTTTENTEKAKVFETKLDSDDPSDDLMFLEFLEGERPDALISGAPYIIDRVYNYKNALEGEILTYIGINNIGGSEKKEHLITAEVDANDEFIDACGDSFFDNLLAFAKNVKEVFGVNLTPERKKKETATPEIKKEVIEEYDEGGEE